VLAWDKGGVASSELALFRAFPALRQRIPWRPFLSGTTPVTPFPLEGFPDGRLFLKHDDRVCPLYGGNKPRKLEFLIGAALARGCRRLVTFGGIGTNHGLATAILGREAGLSTTLVMVHQPVTPRVRQTSLLHAAWGAELVYGRNVPGTALQTLRVLAAAQLRGERPCLVPVGGSGPSGNLGFVSAGLELAEQVRAGALPEPSLIFLPVGSGGSIAGLVVGLKLAGLSTRVRGVLVTDIMPPNPRSLARAARATLQLLRRHVPEVPELPFGAGDFEILLDHLGAGYGSPTPEAEAAVAAAAEHGIQLETTYTGKCLAALRNSRAELPEGPILFWNTFNSVDVAACAPTEPTPEALPQRIRQLLEPFPDPAGPTSATR
jgi:D-cysteine desulfhydrase